MSRVLPSEVLVKSVEDPRSYRILWLGNRLRCILVSDASCDKAAAAAGVGAGHFSDPATLPGLAHFTEHMCFLGTAKYPDEGEYKKYLSAHGGGSNASTSMEYTQYYFSVAHSHLEGALDRFAQFFVAPLFTPSATARELNAVNAEHAKNVQTDSRRMFQLVKSTCNPQHPFHKFGTGHMGTLRDTPHGIDPRSAVVEFFTRHYTAENMSLAVVGRESLDELEALVQTKFAGVRATAADVSPSLPVPDSAAAPILEPVVPASEWVPAFGAAQVGRLYRVVPVADVRTLRLCFPLPPVREHYRAQPARILSHQLGHEAAGSLLALLKQRGWANSLSAGIEYSTATFAVFGCSVQLTEAGLANCEAIVSLVFRFIALMQAQSDADLVRVHDEIAAIASAAFQYKGVEEPQSYASTLAHALHLYAPEHVLSGERLMHDVRVDLARAWMQLLRADNCNVFVIAKAHAGQTNCKEHWFGTEYACEPIPESWLRSIRDHAPVDGALHLPVANPFMATDFSLVAAPSEVRAAPAPLYTLGPAGALHDAAAAADSPSASVAIRDDACLFEAPVHVHDSPTLSVWHKLDNRFFKPKARLTIKVYTPAMHNEPLTQLCSQLLVSLVNDALDDVAYDASLAGLGSDVENADFSLKFTVSGFNDKLSVLAEKVVDRFMTTELRADRFAALRERLTRSLRNFAKSQPHEHADYHRQLLLSSAAGHLNERLAVIGELTLDHLEAHRRTLFRQARIECFVHGNVATDAAVDLCRQLAAKLRQTTTLGLLPAHWAQLQNAQRTVRLAERTTVFHRVTHPNADEKNSACTNVWQIGPNTRETRVRAMLVARLLKAPIFAQLRTREQLGYLVWSGYFVQHGVVHFFVTVQSAEQSADYLHQRIEACMHWCHSGVLGATTRDEWETNRASLIQNLLETPKTAAAEASDMYAEINNRRLDFARTVDDARAVNALRLPDDAIAFYEQYLAAGAPNRCRLSAQVFAARHTIPERVGTDVGVGVGDVQLRAPADTSTHVHVDGIDAFKAGAALFPYLGKL